MANSKFRSTYFEGFRPTRIAKYHSTDTTFNLNQSATYIDVPMVGNPTRVDEGYTTQTNGVQVNFSGYIEVETNIQYFSSSQRTTPRITFAVNGVPTQTKGLSYIRNSSGHQESSIFIKDGFNVNAGDVITVQSQDYSGANAILQGPASYFSIKREAFLERQALSKKQVVWLWGEENGAGTGNNFEYSFGNGATGTNNNRGIPAPRGGKITKLSLITQTAATSAFEVAVGLNGVRQSAYSVTVATGQNKNVISFITPLPFNALDVINFETVTAGGSNVMAVIAEIELDGE